MGNKEFLEAVAKLFTGCNIFIQAGVDTLQLGKAHLGEVAAGGEEAVFLYFGHEPQAAPAPLSMVWDQIQLQGALRMDFLKKGDMPVVDASLMSPFSAPKGRRIDEI